MSFQKTLEASQEWARILHCSYVTDLNEIVENGNIGELIRVSEALHEKRIANIADEIARKIATRRLVLIAGPSSSGKTSFAQRLRVQLRVMGLEPVSISMDDYFHNREDTPKKPNGEYDFECLGAIDLPLFNHDLQKLLAGELVRIPKFNFKKGTRDSKPSAVIQLKPNQPIIIEGIHGLNDRVSSSIPREEKFKIYVSSLTPLYMNEEVRLSTTQARLFRRIVRDYRTRGTSAAETIRRWPTVLEGEQKNIYPFQDEVDATFNSALLYELAVLKKYAMYMLSEIPPEDDVYGRAEELLAFCRYFKAIMDEKDIPNTSILREFIGGSCFDVG